MARVTKSVVPPGAYGTMISICRLGYGCACASAPNSATPVAPSARTARDNSCLITNPSGVSFGQLGKREAGHADVFLVARIDHDRVIADDLQVRIAVATVLQEA